MENLNNRIYSIIDYCFKNTSLLEEAFTHPSMSKKNNKGQVVNYERLEFLGDSILNMIVSEMLFVLFPQEQEGDLARRKMDLVSGGTIAGIAKAINLNQFIIMNNSERYNGGEYNPRNLENVLEALIGAIYLDGGFDSAKNFVTTYWKKLAQDMITPPQDYKTALQEWTQKNKLPLPCYKLISKVGESHRPEFTISVFIEKYGEVSSCAYSKKLAEQKAAELMLNKIS
ncbi:ribonuclease III [Wolbachia endosymbiont of Pentidionis agamae]|uniref:ribonuclease III n=1 Tax=Wolbachia endosymbiont of Pentidionis agamae TaxID=3110435 RepID=UPI002FD1D206